jgi:hypothetical protein
MNAPSRTLVNPFPPFDSRIARSSGRQRTATSEWRGCLDARLGLTRSRTSLGPGSLEVELNLPWWCDYPDQHSALDPRTSRLFQAERRPDSTLRNVGIRNNAFENHDDFIRTLETNALIGGGQRLSIRRYLVRPRAEHFSVDLGAYLQRL